MPDTHPKGRMTVIAVLCGVAVVAGVSALLLSGPDPIPVPADVPPESTVSPSASVREDDSAQPAEDTTPDAGEVPTATTTAGPTERVPALVVSTETEGDVVYLEVDYIQFLTGDEAAAAAAERGDESPPPNDYYIVNDNTRLRRFAVQDGISVNVVVRDDGTSDPGGRTMPLLDWTTRLEGPNAGAFMASFYWLTISGETITTIEQQYLP